MVITYLGDNYIRVQSGNFLVLIDPVNIRSFKGANLILNTLKPAHVNRKDAGGTDAFWVENQGEYEIQGVRAEGWSAGFHDGKEHTAYLFTLEQVSVACLGHLEDAPNAELVEKLQGADILILPAGGEPYLSVAAAAKAARQIEPGIIIPSLFGVSPGKFLSELGHSSEPEEKLTVKKKDITPGAMIPHYLKS